MVAVRFSALAAGAPAARVTARRAFRVAARVFDSCPDEPRAPRALRRAGAVACERIVAVVAITERSVARVGCGYNPDGVARGACPACANPPRPKSGEGGACLSSHASLHHASRQKNCHAISARVLGLSDGSKRPYKKPHTRASVCGWSSRITPALNTQIQNDEGSPHRAHDEGLPRAWKSSRWSDLPTRALPRAATPPARSPRADAVNGRAANHRSPSSGGSRVAWRSPAWRSRAPGWRGSPRPTQTEATRYTRPSTPPSPRVRAGRTSPPRDEPRDLPRQKCATGETTTKKTAYSSYLIGRNLRLTPPPPRPFPQARTSARPRRVPRPRTPSASPSLTRRTSARRRSPGGSSPIRRDRRRCRARALR